MNIQLNEGYTLILNHDEVIALAKAILEYTQLHDIQDKPVTLEELQTNIHLMHVADKLPDI